MLINFSNHPSNKWCDAQINAAVASFGSISDIKFPAVSPGFSSEEVMEIAKQYVSEMLSMAPDAVLCQGESSLTFEATALLLQRGIKVICACSERDVEEEVDENGGTKKVVKFRFAGFRECMLPPQQVTEVTNERNDIGAI